jgi:hypothetical protein
MTKPNPYLWPEKAKLAVYNGRGRCLWRSSDRRLDLSDNLMGFWNRPTRTVYLGMLTTNERWMRWDEEAVSRIERLISYDLGFDGYQVTIHRMTVADKLNCAEEFLWKLKIRTR